MLTLDRVALVPRAPTQSVQMPANEKSGRDLSSANHTTSFLPAIGCGEPSAFFRDFAFGLSLYSEKLVAGTRQRFSGLIQRRQCGDVGLRMLVLMPPNCGGFGKPQRILISSRPLSSLRTTGAS